MNEMCLINDWEWSRIQTEAPQEVLSELGQPGTVAGRPGMFWLDSRQLSVVRAWRHLRRTKGAWAAGASHPVVDLQGLQEAASNCGPAAYFLPHSMWRFLQANAPQELIADIGEPQGELGQCYIIDERQMRLINTWALFRAADEEE